MDFTCPIGIPMMFPMISNGKCKIPCISPMNFPFQGFYSQPSQQLCLMAILQGPSVHAAVVATASGATPMATVKRISSSDIYINVYVYIYIYILNIQRERERAVFIYLFGEREISYFYSVDIICIYIYR